MALADLTGRHTVLYPAITEAAHRLGATTIGLIDLRCRAGFNLTVDRAGITYSNGQFLGDPSSPLQLTASIVGDRPLPARQMPEVVTRIGIDRDPIDARRSGGLPAAEVTLATTSGLLLLRGDPVDLLPDALAQVPADALPVVTTTWALSQIRPARRQLFLQRLTGADRPLAWVSAEGVGVAPTIPTLGDRPASGHSILGLAIFNGPTHHTEALGRCWSRGRLLSWLA